MWQRSELLVGQPIGGAGRLLRRYLLGQQLSGLEREPVSLPMRQKSRSTAVGWFTGRTTGPGACAEALSRTVSFGDKVWAAGHCGDLRPFHAGNAFGRNTQHLALILSTDVTLEMDDSIMGPHVAHDRCWKPRNVFEHQADGIVDFRVIHPRGRGGRRRNRRALLHEIGSAYDADHLASLDHGSRLM
jgi:hypothetical protein